MSTVRDIKIDLTSPTAHHIQSVLTVRCARVVLYNTVRTRSKFLSAAYYHRTSLVNKLARGQTIQYDAKLNGLHLYRHARS